VDLIDPDPRLSYFMQSKPALA